MIRKTYISKHNTLHKTFWFHCLFLIAHATLNFYVPYLLNFLQIPQPNRINPPENTVKLSILPKISV